MGRTSTVKSWDEANAFLLAQLKDGAESDGVKTRIFQTAAGDSKTTDDGDEGPLASGDKVIVVPVTPIYVVTTVKIGSNTALSFAAGTPPGQGQRLTLATSETILLTGGATGYVFDVLLDYDEETTTFPTTPQSYLQNLSGGTPETTRDVRDKGTLKHRKRMATVEKTLSVTQLFTNYGEGLLAFNEIPYIMRIQRKDDRAGLATEVCYYYSCFQHGPIPNESGGDTDTDNSFDIRYERFVTVAG